MSTAPAGRPQTPPSMTVARAIWAADAPRPTLTVVPAPRTSPPPAPPPLTLVPGRLPAQPELPLEWESAPAARTLTAVPALPDGGGALPPDLQAWVGRLAAGVLEVLHGVRPAAQLSRWFAPRVHRALADRAARVRPLQQGPPRIAVRSVHVSGRSSDDGEDLTVVEAAAVVAVGPRCRAVALRLEPHAGRWRVTALEVG